MLNLRDLRIDPANLGRKMLQVDVMPAYEYRRHYRPSFLIECSKEGGCAMAKQEVQLTFTFVNPNTPKEFERQLQKILINKLLSQYWDSRVAKS